MEYYNFNDLKEKLKVDKYTMMRFRKDGFPHVFVKGRAVYPKDQVNELYGLDISQYDFLTKKGLADKYGVTTRTIENWQNDGLPYIKRKGLLLYPVQLVDEWVKNQNK